MDDQDVAGQHLPAGGPHDLADTSNRLAAPGMWGRREDDAEFIDPLDGASGRGEQAG
ncbi:hypothetical protein [Micromonospora sp. NPDC057141]|uniref:hypothetical protein n=1 Tax=Micromonospora sp. NPDC057141 TaxID=3346033 RepID=UPI0036453D9C